MPELSIQSQGHVEARDVTELIAERSWPDGFLWVGTPHTTVALFLCEADAEMLADIERLAGDLLRPLEPFRHHKNDNPNAAAHLMSSLFGTQVLLPVRGGRVLLGSHQRIVFLDLDGPRLRRLVLSSVASVEPASEREAT